jgi:hypothetical protein
MPVANGIRGLEAQKRALVEESEAQREVIVAELRQLRLTAEVWQRRLKVVSAAASVVAVLGPVAGAIVKGRFSDLQEPGPKEGSKRTLLGTVLAGWRIYREVAPVVQAFLARRREDNE